MIVAREFRRRAYGLGEFGYMYGISKDSAKRLAKDGRLRTILIGGRRLVPIDECERIEKEGIPLRRKQRKGAQQ